MIERRGDSNNISHTDLAVNEVVGRKTMFANRRLGAISVKKIDSAGQPTAGEFATIRYCK